MISNIRRA